MSLLCLIIMCLAVVLSEGIFSPVADVRVILLVDEGSSMGRGLAEAMKRHMEEKEVITYEVQVSVIG